MLPRLVQPPGEVGRGRRGLGNLALQGHHLLLGRGGVHGRADVVGQLQGGVGRHEGRLVERALRQPLAEREQQDVQHVGRQGSTRCRSRWAAGGPAGGRRCRTRGCGPAPPCGSRPRRRRPRRAARPTPGCAAARPARPTRPTAAAPAARRPARRRRPADPAGRARRMRPARSTVPTRTGPAGAARRSRPPPPKAGRPNASRVACDPVPRTGTAERTPGARVVAGRAATTVGEPADHSRRTNVVVGGRGGESPAVTNRPAGLLGVAASGGVSATKTAGASGRSDGPTGVGATVRSAVRQ